MTALKLDRPWAFDANSQRLLGAALPGLFGGEGVHAQPDVTAAGQPCATIARTVHPGPSVPELVPTLLQQLRP